jgi:hypothetical protein
MNSYRIWNNDLGYRSITYTCCDDPMAAGPYDWTSHFGPDEYDEYQKMIAGLERAGYVFVAAKPTTVCDKAAELVPALRKKRVAE